MNAKTSALYERLLPRPKRLTASGPTLTLVPGTSARINGCEKLADYLFPGLFDFAEADTPVFQAVRCDSLAEGGYTLSVSDKGVFIAAGWLGKVKTVVQMVMCMLLLFTANEDYDGIIFMIADAFGWVAMWLALILTVASLVVYIWQNRWILTDKHE